VKDPTVADLLARLDAQEKEIAILRRMGAQEAATQRMASSLEVLERSARQALPFDRNQLLIEAEAFVDANIEAPWCACILDNAVPIIIESVRGPVRVDGQLLITELPESAMPLVGVGCQLRQRPSPYYSARGICNFRFPDSYVEMRWRVYRERFQPQYAKYSKTSDRESADVSLQKHVNTQILCERLSLQSRFEGSPTTPLSKLVARGLRPLKRFDSEAAFNQAMNDGSLFALAAELGDKRLSLEEIGFGEIVSGVPLADAVKVKETIAASRQRLAREAFEALKGDGAR
jgi:hypothetical protein